MPKVTHSIWQLTESRRYVQNMPCQRHLYFIRQQQHTTRCERREYIIKIQYPPSSPEKPWTSVLVIYFDGKNALCSTNYRTHSHNFVSLSLKYYQFLKKDMKLEQKIEEKSNHKQRYCIFVLLSNPFIGRSQQFTSYNFKSK